MVGSANWQFITVQEVLQPSIKPLWTPCVPYFSFLSSFLDSLLTSWHHGQVLTLLGQFSSRQSERMSWSITSSGLFNSGEYRCIIKWCALQKSFEYQTLGLESLQCAFKFGVSLFMELSAVSLNSFYLQWISVVSSFSHHITFSQNVKSLNHSCSLIHLLHCPPQYIYCS